MDGDFELVVVVDDVVGDLDCCLVGDWLVVFGVLEVLGCFVDVFCAIHDD